MKLKVTKITLEIPVEGTRSTIIPDTLGGDSVGIANGKNLLTVKLSDLVNFISEQEAQESREQNTCPA